jgi:hypothetical protein
MKVDTKTAASALRQDLLRGIRWGTILLIAMLLSIAAYRVLSSSPAVAHDPAVAEELVPAVDAIVTPDSVITVGEAEVKPSQTPSVPAAPRPRSTVKAPARVIAPPTRFSAPRFEPAPVAAPPPMANAFVPDPMTEVSVSPAPVVGAPSTSTILTSESTLAPPPPDDSKQGNVAVRAVRSVGRIFRFGRKDPEPETEPAKK